MSEATALPCRWDRTQEKFAFETVPTDCYFNLPPYLGTHRFFVNYFTEQILTYVGCVREGHERDASDRSRRTRGCARSTFRGRPRTEAGEPGQEQNGAPHLERSRRKDFYASQVLSLLPRINL